MSCGPRYEINKKDLFQNVRTVWNPAIWKYPPNHAVCGAVHRQRQGPILVVETQISLFKYDLTARSAYRTRMSPALHAAANDRSTDDSWAP